MATLMRTRKKPLDFGIQNSLTTSRRGFWQSRVRPQKVEKRKGSQRKGCYLWVVKHRHLQLASPGSNPHSVFTSSVFLLSYLNFPRQFPCLYR